MDVIIGSLFGIIGGILFVWIVTWEDRPIDATWREVETGRDLVPLSDNDTEV